MKVILTQDLKNIGKQDEIVNVSEGYARNYLYPRKLAVEASGSHLAEWEKRRKAEIAKGEKMLAQAKELAARLADVKVIVKAKAGTGSRLFGSVTSADIADSLEKQTGMKIDKRKIELTEPVKTLGIHDVPLRLHKDVAAHLKIEVVGE